MRGVGWGGGGSHNRDFTIFVTDDFPGINKTKISNNTAQFWPPNSKLTVTVPL